MPLYEFPNKAFPGGIFDLGGDAQGNPGGQSWDAKEQVVRTLADCTGFKYVIASVITDADVATAPHPCLIMDRRSNENDPPKYGLKDSATITTIAACKNPFTEENMQMLQMFFGADHALIQKKHRRNVGLLVADGTASDDFGGGPYPDDTDATTGWVAKGNTAGTPRMWRDLRDLTKPSEMVWDPANSKYVPFKGAGGGAAIFAGGEKFAVSAAHKQFKTNYSPSGLAADGKELTGFTLSGTDASLFKINTSGELEFITVPDFSSPTDADKDNVYDLIVEEPSGSKQTLQVTVVDVSDYLDCISAGKEHSLVLLADGTIKSFGRNNNGQLGDGTTTDRLTPVAVSGITNAKAVSAGDAVSFAVLKDGTAMLFGWYRHAINSSPIVFSGNVKAVSAGLGGSNLILLRDGSVLSYGMNDRGQLGHSANQPNIYTSHKVTGITNAVAVSAGGGHSLVLLADGTVMSFGSNAVGQLGQRHTSTSNPIPKLVYNITNAVAVSAGGGHSLVLLEDGTVMAFGVNNRGQLGDGTTNYQHTAKQALGVANARAVIAGINLSLVLFGDGGGMWLGTASSKDLGITNTISASLGTGHTLLLLKDGTVKANGKNTYGQLGDGTQTDRGDYTAVAGIANAGK